MVSTKYWAPQLTPSHRPKPPPGSWIEKSLSVKRDTVTSPTSMRVVPAVPSWIRLIGAAICRSGYGSPLPVAVVSSTSSQLRPNRPTGTGVPVVTRARTIRSMREAPCTGVTTMRGSSPPCRPRSMLIGPHGDCGLPPGQHIAGVPPQLSGMSNASGPPVTAEISAAGSDVSDARPLCETRIWPAFWVRSAAGNPPGMGDMQEQPPPPHPKAFASTTKTRIGL
jgi:hypothetical protein